MIEIKFEAANGADLRKEMLALLGVSNYFVGIDPAQPGQDKTAEVTTENGIITDIKISGDDVANVITERIKAPRKKASTTEPVKAETPANEPPADTNEPVKDETPADTNEPVKDETPATDAVPAAITAEDLTRKAVELGRSGKRDDLLAVLDEKFGGATIAKKDGKPQLTPDQYEAVMEAFNAIG